jgi:transposase, IS5 family
MLRTISPQPSLWEAMLPEVALRMPAELEAVDRLLDDPAFFEPYRAHFDPVCGRPSTPIETYLRMMFLKHRHHLGYEVLCREVADSISWSRFCRIPFGAPVPHPTTLMKITTRCGEEAVEALNDTLLAKAAGARVIKLDRARADTTVVEANVSYPTDCGLLARAVGRIARLVERIHAAGGATRTKVRDRRRAAGRRARSIAAHLKLRGDDAKAQVRSITKELAALAETAAAEAQGVVTNARRKLAREGLDPSCRLASLVAELETTMARARQVVAQTRIRLRGATPDGATRLVSLHDPDARPIAKGRLGRPVEFGYYAASRIMPRGGLEPFSSTGLGALLSA